MVVVGSCGELRSVNTLSLEEMLPLLMDVEEPCSEELGTVPVPESTGDMEWRLDVETPIPELEINGRVSLTEPSLEEGEGLPVEPAPCRSTGEELVGLSPLSEVGGRGERSGEGTFSSSRGLTEVPSARSMTGIGS